MPIKAADAASGLRALQGEFIDGGVSTANNKKAGIVPGLLLQRA
jgi:hypothetical protein